MLRLIHNVVYKGGVSFEVDEYGTKGWWINDKHHREDGLPAIEWSDGTKMWCLNGKCHREDGPAIEKANGYKEWYLYDSELTEEEFNAQVNS